MSAVFRHETARQDLVEHFIYPPGNPRRIEHVKQAQRTLHQDAAKRD